MSICLFYRLLLSLRYRMKIRGLDALSGSEPCLFLADFTSELDPLLILLAIRKKGSAKTILSPSMCSTGWLKRLLVHFRSVFTFPYTEKLTGFQFKRLQAEAVSLNEALSHGQSLLVFLCQKLTASPSIRLQNNQLIPLLSSSVPIVLVRVEGMRGSSFSLSKSPGAQFLTRSVAACLKLLTKNGVFFIPRRPITIVFEKAPKEINELNAWFSYPGVEKIHSIPYFFWQRKASVIPPLSSNIIRQEVLAHLEKKSGRQRKAIALTQSLYGDLNFDSLDITELLVFLEQNFHKHVHFDDLQTVEDVVLAAEGKKSSPEKQQSLTKDQHRWNSERQEVAIPKGDTLPEVFLRTCARMGSQIACVDGSTLSSYQRLKSISIGFAESFRTLPGERVGIFLPSSALVAEIVFALFLLKKVPAMLNGSLGIKHFEDAVEIGQLEVIITSAAYLEATKLDIPPHLEKKIRLIEEMRESLDYKKRQKGIELAKQKTETLLKHYRLQKLSKQAPAVLLFTSGTEKKPKGVPLSHENLLSNQRGALERINLNKSDVLCALLPAFHVFGFSVGHLLPLLSGLRVIFAPNFLDFAQMGQLIDLWGATVVATAPTFLKALLSIASKEQLRSVRLFVVGAEKAPQTLFTQVKDLGNNSQIIEGYGLTECSPILTLNNPFEPPQGVGFPLPLIELAIVDPEAFKTVSKGQKGMVLVRGPNILKGYLDVDFDPFVIFQGKSWFSTGDIGFLDEKGALHLLGRQSRTVKVGAEMVSLSALEEALFPLLRAPTHRLACLAEPSEDRGVDLILCCNFSLELAEANDLLKTAGYSNLIKIKRIKQVAHFPILPSGKTDYRTLEEGM